MAEDVGIDKVEGIYTYADDDGKLIVAVVRIIVAADAAGGVGCVGLEVGLVVVGEAVKVLVFEHFHVSVVVVDEVADAGEGTVDDGDLPGLSVVDLPASRDDGPAECDIGGVLLCAEGVGVGKKENESQACEESKCRFS